MRLHLKKLIGHKIMKHLQQACSYCLACMAISEGSFYFLLKSFARKKIRIFFLNSFFPCKHFTADSVCRQLL